MVCETRTVRRRVEQEGKVGLQVIGGDEDRALRGPCARRSHPGRMFRHIITNLEVRLMGMMCLFSVTMEHVLQAYSQII